MNLVFALLDLYTWVIIIRALLSWLSPDPRNPLVRLLYQFTEPVLAPLRQLLPPQRLGGLDISPILAIAAIQVVKYLVVSVAF